jgi:hypothetical protein
MKSLNFFSISLLSIACCISAQQQAAVIDTIAHDRIDTGKAVIDSFGRVHDTLATISSDTPEKNRAGKTSPKTTPPVDSTELEDTSYTFWLYPFLGAGAGFTIGNFPVFDIWYRGLPDSLGNFGIPQDTVLKGSFGNGDTLDTLHLLFELKEKPNAYTISFPLFLSRYFLTSEKSYCAIDLSFFMLFKQMQAAVRDDSTTNRVSLKQSLGFYTGALGIRYQAAIPARYFTIDGLNRSSVCAGLDIHPLVYLRKKSTVTVENDADPLFADFKNRVAAAVDNHSSFGFGISWKAGISALKKYSSYTGLEAGLMYAGQWFIFPDMSEKALDKNAITSKNNYSFICHRLSIQLSLLRGKKKLH